MEREIKYSNLEEKNHPLIEFVDLNTFEFNPLAKNKLQIPPYQILVKS